MSSPRKISCLINAGGAQLYCETAGAGQPFVMIHAGVADCRQWNNEFTDFSRKYKVVRYDMRGYGRSEPVGGEFSHLRDLLTVLDTLEIHQPAVLMGCSLGGGLALDFALDHPPRVQALIMVGSGPAGLELDVPRSPKNEEADAAFEAGDLDRAAELETQIWFDGARTRERVDPEMRKLAYEMDRLALRHQATRLGKRLPNTTRPAAERLADLKAPLLLIVGAQDEPYALAAADFVLERIPGARMAVLQDAAHLPNLDHPDEFRAIVDNFLRSPSQ